MKRITRRHLLQSAGAVAAGAVAGCATTSETTSAAPMPFVVAGTTIPVVEKPEEVHWVDNIHPAPKK